MNSEITSLKPKPDGRYRYWGRLFIFLVFLLFVNGPEPSLPLPFQISRAGTDRGRADIEPKLTTATFVAVGDIMLSRGVDRAINRTGNPMLPFSGVDELLCGSDFNFGNLESPIAGNDWQNGRGLVFNAHIHDTRGLIQLNFKVLNLANNHALDRGFSGLRFTRKYLETNQIQFLGTGESKSEAWEPKIIAKNGIRIGFIGASYSSVNDGGGRRNPYVARIEDLFELKESIANLRLRSDFVIVTMHAGIEYTRHPNAAQIRFARLAIDYGADLIIGGHPHWIQTIENYRGKYIFYSLGNFIFDQRKTDTKEGLALKITLRRKEFDNGAAVTGIARVELIPVINERLGVPRPASPAETERILKKIGARQQIIVP